MASEEAAVKKPSAGKIPFEGVTASGERIQGEIDRRFLIVSQPDKDNSPEAGEQGGTAEVNQVTARAIEVIGDRMEEALRWLGTPVRGLGYKTPISLLHDSEGQEAEFLTLLGRLEHGVL